MDILRIAGLWLDDKVDPAQGKPIVVRPYADFFELRDGVMADAA